MTQHIMRTTAVKPPACRYPRTLLAGICLLAWLITPAVHAAGTLEPYTETGPAREFSLKDTRGEMHRLEDYRGKVVLHPSVAYVLLRALQTQSTADETALQTLTDREIEVLQLVARGRTNQDISAQLGIDERTVRVHVTHILQKLDLHNRTQAALFALRNGLAGLE